MKRTKSPAVETKRKHPTNKKDEPRIRTRPPLQNSISLNYFADAITSFFNTLTSTRPPTTCFPASPLAGTLPMLST